ncbi:TPA: O107/O117 family O-antigen flippase, partial [Escherichia coli]
AIGAQKQLLIRNLIIKTMFVIIAIFILEVYKNIAVYFVIFGLNIIIANFLLGIYSFTKIKNKEYILFSNGWGGNRLFCFIKDAKFFFLSPTIGAVYQYGDQILVSLLFPKTALVFINLAKQIIGASVMVSGTLCRVEQKNIFSSEKIERLTKIKKTLMAYVFYLMTTSILIILIGPLILGMLIKETVSLGLNYYILIAGIYVFTSLSIFIDYIIGLTFRTEHYTSISNICCATIVTLLNAMFLEKYGATFSLFSLFIGELLVFILLSTMHYINIKRRTYYNG